MTPEHSSEIRHAAVVGLGIGMAHVAGYLSSPDARLVAVADAWAPRRARVGGTFDQGSMLNLKPLFDAGILARGWDELGVRAYEDVRAVIDDPEIDLVSLCTPDDTHEDYAIAIMEAGKDLLLEKPVALSLASASRICECATRTGRRVAVGYEMRVNPAVLKVHELIRAGAVGEVVAFNLQQYRKPFRRDKWQQWIQRRDRSGGLIVEETCHWFDLARYLTGKEIRRVHCVGTDQVLPEFDYEDIAFVQGTYADGSIFQIGHALTGFDFSLAIQVHGTAGTVWCGMKADRRSILDAGQTDWLAVVAWGPPDAPSGGVVTFGAEALEGESIRENVVRVSRALSRGDAFPAELADGVKSLEIALAATRSLSQGEPEEIQ